MRDLHLILQPPASSQAESLEALIHAMPGLRALLGRGRELPPTACLSEACCLSLGVPRQQDWPVAPITARAAGMAVEAGYWLRLDPVFLDVGMRGLFLRADTALTPGEAEALGALISPLLAHHGLTVSPTPDGPLFVRLDAPPRLSTTPLDRVDGRQPTRFLPAGEGAPFWIQVLHEVQMALHDHPINLDRAAAGQAPVNSLWLWGGGEDVAPPGHIPGQVWADAPLARQLARGLDIECLPLPDALPELGTRSGPGGLVVLDASAWQAGSSPQELDTRWFRPLVTALRWGRLGGVTLRIVDGNWPGRHLGPQDVWRFW